MTDRELLQQALDALDYEAERGNDDAYHPLRDALRERLVQPEPVSYAGIKIWIGDRQVVQHLTQTQLHHARDPWMLVEMTAGNCIAALKEDT